MCVGVFRNSTQPQIERPKLKRVDTPATLNGVSLLAQTETSSSKSGITSPTNTKNSEPVHTTTTQATQSLERTVSAAVAQGGIKDPKLSSLNSVSSGVKKLAGNVGGLLSKVNKEFDVVGGTVDTFKDAFKDKDGNVSVENTMRTTTEYSKKAQDGITNLVGTAFDGIDKGVNKAFKTLDETFTPGKTLSAAVGKYKEAKASGSTWNKVKAGFGVAWAGVKATGSFVTKNIAKLGVGVGGFVAGSAVAVGGIAAKSVVTVLTPVAKATEAVGRVVVAPIVAGVGNAVGKVVVGTTVAVGGGLAIAGKATRISDGLSYLGGKISSGLEKIGDAIHTNKGKQSMKEIDSLLADPEIGISKDQVNTATDDVKKSKGQDFETLGFKGTAKKWFNIVMGKTKTTVGDVLANKNLLNETTATSVQTGVTWGQRGITGAGQLIKGGQHISDLSHAASTALPYANAVGGVGGVIDGATTIGKSSYDIHKARKMNERVDAFKDPVKLAERLEKKAAALEKEAVEVAKDGIIFSADPKKAEKLNERAKSLRADAEKLKTMKVDPEMTSIAKQVGSRHGMGLSSAGIIKGGLGVAGGTVASVNTIATIAVGTALVANPVGPALLGAGVAVGVGVAAYKIHKELSRENMNNKLEAQLKLVDDKLKTATGSSKEKLEQVREKILDLRAKKDPQFAAQQLTSRINSNPEPSDTKGVAAKEQAIQFVKNVLKLNPDDIKPTAMPLSVA